MQIYWMVLLVTVFLGCSKPFVVFRKDGIYFNRYFYLVKYSDPQQKQIISRDWILDNFHHDGDRYVMNKGKRYRGYLMIDRDGDGKHEKEPTYIFDLKLNHRTSNAVIWVQNIELSYKDADKSIESLVASYAGSLTGAGFYAESNMFTILTVKQKRYAAVTRHKARTRLGPYQAITARIQVYNMDQMKIEPSHKGEVIQVTLTKVYFKGKRYRTSETIWGASVMIVGYCNSAAAFDRSFADYRRFLKQIRFDTPWKPKRR